MVNPGNAISAQRLGGRTAEARRARTKEFLIKKYSELCELCASVVNTPFTVNPEDPKIKSGQIRNR
jgi:hypothetical protein